MNGTGLHGETTTSPFVYLDPVLEPAMTQVQYTSSARLPIFPALSRPPGEFCSSKVIGRELDVRCLDDEGTPTPVALQLDEVAKRLSVPRECLVIQNELGTRSLEELSQQWKLVLGRCAGAANRRRVAVKLDLERPQEDSGCASAPICALVRLSVPAIGLRKRLGHIWNFPLCTATRMTQPKGIQVSCSDSSESYAAVYTHGGSLFYRVAETDEEIRKGVGPSMQMVELPCGMEPEFEFRSYIPIDGGLTQ
jgi:hypothetical protein